MLFVGLAAVAISTTVSRPAVSSPPGLVYNSRLHANNVFTPRISTAVIREASEDFHDHLRPRFLDVRDQLKQRRMPCEQLQTNLGRFFVVQPGIWSSDIAWISVDDDATYARFLDFFMRSGVPEQLAPHIDHEHGLRMYSAYYVVRSRAQGTNFHDDFVPEIGTNALSVMSPLANYAAPDFQLLYEDVDGRQRQYRYTHGEAICFGSQFQHTTEPGRASEADGGLHVYLCFTFGSDKEEYWPHIYATQGSYGSRVIRKPCGGTALTDMGKHLRQETDDGAGRSS